MGVSIERSVVCPVLIGRTAQARTLAALAAQACAGHGAVAVVSGEAGVGKSRLVTEALASIESPAAATVLTGRCFEQDLALPYAPIIDLLRSLTESRPDGEVTRLLGDASHTLAPLLPGGSRPPGAPGDTPPDRHRLLAALDDLLRRAAGDAAVAAVFEDVHWCDDASLELMLRLARHAPQRRLLLVLTYRDDEAAAGLARLLDALDRERLATELRLAPLSAGDVAAMLRSMFDMPRPVRPEFVHALHQLTDGNPFFIEEVVKLLLSTGEIAPADAHWDEHASLQARVPRSVQHALQQRAAQLSAGAHEVLRLAAVMGRRFDFELLHDLSGRDDDALLALVKELVSSQLVDEDPSGQFAFRHALTREAVYADLLVRERKALHARIAEAIERRHGHAPDAWLSDLAYHFGEAASWERALHYAVLAGERAAAMDAPRPAIQQFSTALAACQRLRRAPAPSLYHARASAYETVGSFDPARADYDRALQLARDAGDRRAEWQALLALGMLWASRDYHQTYPCYEAALELARSIGEPAMVARSLNHLGNWHANVEHPAESLACHREALAIFEGEGDRRGTAETLDLLAMSASIAGDYPQSAAYYERAIALFRDLGDRRGLSSALATAPCASGAYETDATLTLYAPRERIDAQLAEALAASRAIGWRAGESYALLAACDALGPRGAYAQALDGGLRALTIAEEIEHPQWTLAALAMLGVLYTDLLAPAEASPLLERARGLAQDLGSILWQRQCDAYLADLHLSEGAHAAATATLAATLSDETPCETAAQRTQWRARGEAALAAGDAALALSIADKLATSGPPPPPGRVIPRVWMLRGMALAALGRLDEARDALEAALAIARADGLPPIEWRILAALADTARTAGDREAAERHAADARDVIERLAAGIPDPRLSAQFLERASVLLPRPRSRTEAPARLTERECEVAALIARGLTNREIAERLVIERRTVETHVRNIFHKTGASTRARAAVWAVEHGLGGQPAS